MYNPALLNWISLRPVWGLARLAADLRKRQKDRLASTHNWNPHTHLVGLLGEYVYAVVRDLTLDAELRISGDGGADFEGGVDVKTTVYWRDPILKHPSDSTRWPTRFALVALDMDRRRGAVVGEVRAEVLRHAPTHDFGHGPQHILRAADLLDEQWMVGT